MLAKVPFAHPCAPTLTSMAQEIADLVPANVKGSRQIPQAKSVELLVHENVHSKQPTLLTESALVQGSPEPPSSADLAIILAKHAPSLKSLESVLRTLSYILPGRFTHSDFVSEFLLACVRAVGILRNQLALGRPSKCLPHPADPLKPDTPFNRLATSLLSASPLYSGIAHALAYIRTFQLSLEMMARKALGSRARWSLLLCLECVKAACRLSILELFHRMMLHSLLPEPPVENGDVVQSDSSLLKTWPAPRSKKSIPPLSPFLSSATDSNTVEKRKLAVEEYLRERAVLGRSPKAIHLVHKLDLRRRIAEYVYILRPLIYVFLIRRYGRRSWWPFILSLLVELSSLGAHHVKAFQIAPLSFSKSVSMALPIWRTELTHVEKDELDGRAWNLWSYVIQRPAFDAFAQPRLESLARRLSSLPGLSIFGAIIQDYLPILEDYYYATNT